MSLLAFPVLLSRFRRLANKVRSKIVLRAMLSIVGLSGAMGIVVIVGTHYFLQSYEHERALDRIRGMIASVEGTARAAAFAEDPGLAHYVAEGLLQNEMIAKVIIRSRHDLLVEIEHTYHVGHVANAPLIRELASPVDGSTEGRIEVYPEVERVLAASRAYSGLIALLLGIELFTVACAVGWVVFSRVTRPIKHLANELHDLELDTGDIIWPLRGNETDEIGMLARDMNLLIARMQGLLYTERDLREDKELSERKFRLIFENADTGIFVLESDGTLLSWNPALVRILGHAAFSLEESPPRLNTLLGCDQAEIASLISRAAGRDLAVAADFERKAGEGASEWFSVAFNSIEGGRFQGVCNDVTERKHAEALARALAERDALTGLLNRRGFEYRAASMLGTIAPENGVAIVMMDLDGFKAVNDSMGHDAGDAVLCQVARLLERSVRKDDLVARIGGDEFVVLLSELNSASVATTVACKIIASLADPIAIDTKGVAKVGVSIGIALTSERSVQVGDLLRRADEAMYVAKRAGKNTYRLWTSAAQPAPLPE